jgi:hypothetical protein
MFNNDVLPLLEQNIKSTVGIVMNIINEILERRKVIDDESAGGFAIDSFPEKKQKKKREIIRTIYPESKDETLPKRAMIDLDLTIHKYSKGYQDGDIYDDAFSGAKEVIEWLRKKGYEIVIFTTRASEENAKELGGDHKEQIEKVKEWLTDKGIYFDRITGEKLAADFYIDDKAIHIQDGDWKTVLKVIKKRVKYRVV